MRQFKPAGAVPRSSTATHNPYVCFRCEKAARVPKQMGNHVYCKKCVKAVRLHTAKVLGSGDAQPQRDKPEDRRRL